MKTHIDYQKIEYQGHPAFVLIPWDDFQRIRPLLDGENIRSTGIPQAVVEAHILRAVPITRAWREYLGITQGELAARTGVSQAAIAKLEKPNAKPRRATLERVAKALDLSIAQFDV
ncbi:MAG: helix-turn-helix transcriptional regulator [Deltaproteobacteria bacterium]|nr:helix-turn-helix transcriptional regulator [Deltaproteobacteria bacterium]